MPGEAFFSEIVHVFAFGLFFGAAGEFEVLHELGGPSHRQRLAACGFWIRFRGRSGRVSDLQIAAVAQDGNPEAITDLIVCVAA